VASTELAREEGGNRGKVIISWWGYGLARIWPT